MLMYDYKIFYSTRENVFRVYFIISSFFFLLMSFCFLQGNHSYAGLQENINVHQTPPLTAQLQKELQMLNIPAHSWLPHLVTADSIEILDVAIIGGGMNGLAISFALIKEGISNIKVFDENASGKEGPWSRYARMNVLRSDKTDLGPALGIPSLTFWAWYEAQYGEESWTQLKSIPTTMWSHYLYWFKNILNLPLENDITLKSIVPLQDFLELIFEKEGLEQIIYARKIVLATGRDGAGGGEIPEFMKDVSPHLYAHTINSIDMKLLANKKVAIIGAGASAFDAAASALEHGAEAVDVLIRRETLPNANKFTQITQPGAALGFYHLKDDERWTFLAEWLKHGIPPPKETLERIKHFKNLNMHYNAHIQKISSDESSAIISTSQNNLTVDFIIIATGFAVDLSRRPELANISKEILLWEACVSQELKAQNSKLGKFPYLGPHFEFLEAHPGDAAYLKNIYCFNYGAFLSHGLLSGDIGLSTLGAMRLVEGIVIDFFVVKSPEFSFLQKKCKKNHK